MTIAEFQAWVEGYSANMGAAPTAEQWRAIKAKIASLSMVDLTPLPSGYKWRQPDAWWECPSHEDNRTKPLRAH